MSRGMWIFVSITFVLVVDVAMCGILGWFTLPALYLAFGWIFYLQQTLPEVTIDEAGVVTAVVTLAALTVGVHLFGRWWLRQKDPANGDTLPEPEAEPHWPVLRTFAIVSLVMLMFVAGLCGTAVVHQTVWLAKSPEPFFGSGAMAAARRTQSMNNLKNIGLAVHNYHDTALALPSSGTFDDAGRPMHSWQTFLLPYHEEKPLYDSIDFSRPWNDSANAKAVATRISFFECPFIRPERIPAEGQPAPSDYAASSHLLGAGSTVTIDSITDGLSNTLLAGEVNANSKPWADPTNIRDPSLGINASPDGFGGPYKGSAVFLLVDGSIRTISETIDPQVLHALTTPAAGDDASGDW
jgi:hypothetical protein